MHFVTPSATPKPAATASSVPTILFIVNGCEEGVVETDWKKMVGGGTAMFIKFSEMAAFDAGVEVLRSPKAFEGCLVERIRG
ncbi:hypothetical protein L873DRAFT_1811558 [Choiromyces venosus 120613-1]|uniref:Uncharacterized protein n=1 Tax=Choiromyces venosus 120613-1 TaxID=1336337 RepID=A0A3N4JDN7_9PEZI|nr:hypothetical protein L873DRAFT_1811558 [Choiromyces venosus 120613-1]